ncbi:MAG TPA: hypothetical protein VD999_07255 [Vitreimonas sp.]|nr:hypothetical protein [Vitreimonas sp.]
MKRLFLAYAWMLLTAGAMLTLIAAVQVYGFHTQVTTQAKILHPVLTASAQELDSTDEIGEVKGMAIVAEVDDARPQIVANFLKRYKSPLEPHDYFGQFLVDTADKNGLDFRLLPAIAMQESNLCKKIPEGSYNCLGFGIHSRGTLAFESYEANFERAARELKKNYIDIGLTTPDLIMKKYTPGSNGSWSNSVKQWMAEMRYDDRKLGKALKTDTSVLEFAESSESTSSASPAPSSTP